MGEMENEEAQRGWEGRLVKFTEMFLCTRHCGRQCYVPIAYSSPGHVNTCGNSALAKLLDFSKPQSQGTQKPRIKLNVDDEKLMKQH